MYIVTPGFSDVDLLGSLISGENYQYNRVNLVCELL